MYVPEFKGPVEGYLVNQLSRNLWKLRPLYEHDDAMQEGYLVFMRVAARYPMLNDPPQFMALFKQAWSNHMIDLAKKATAARCMVSENQFDDEANEAWSRDHVGDLDTNGFVSILIQQAPGEVRLVLNLFLNAPHDLLEMAGAAWSKSRKHDPSGNRFINRLLGLPDDHDSIGKVRRYFQEQ